MNTILKYVFSEFFSGSFNFFLVLEVSKVGHVVIFFVKVIHVLSHIFFIIHSLIVIFFAILFFFWIGLDFFIRERTLVGFAVFLEPFPKAVERSSLSDDAFLVVLRIEHQGWEAFDLNLLVLVGGCIVLGDDEVTNILDVLTELFPVGSELLAVTAPWSVVLDKYVFARIKHDIFEGMSYDYFNWSFVVFWNGVTLKEGSQLAILEIGNELFDILNCKF